MKYSDGNTPTAHAGNNKGNNKGISRRVVTSASCGVTPAFDDFYT